MPSRLIRPTVGRPDQAVDRCRTGDAAIGFGTDADGGQAGRDGRTGAGTGAAGITIQRIWIAREPPRPLQPELDWVERKLAHSLRLVLPRITAPAVRRRCTINASRAGRNSARARGAGAVDHRQRVDIVLEQHRDAVQRPTHVAGFAFGIQGACVGFGLWIEFDHRVEPGAGAIDAGNTLQIRARQLQAAALAAGHARLQAGHVGLAQIERVGGGRVGSACRRTRRIIGMRTAAQRGKQREGQKGGSHGWSSPGRSRRLTALRRGDNVRTCPPTGRQAQRRRRRTRSRASTPTTSRLIASTPQAVQPG